MVYNGRRFPPKAVFGLAAARATGRGFGPGDFRGGDETLCYRALRQLGLRIEPKSATGEELLLADSWSHRAARAALPILVGHAHRAECAFYSTLAPKIGVSNPRNVGTALDVMGTALHQLITDGWYDDIPPLQSLVVNKGSDLPGRGFDHYFKSPNLVGMSNAERRRFMRLVHREVFAYQRWHEDLEALGIQAHTLPPLEFDVATADVPAQAEAPCSPADIDARLAQLAEQLLGRSNVYVRQMVARIVRRDVPLIRALKDKHNHRCQFEGCGVSIPTRTGDHYCEVAHLTPVAAGGQPHLINLVVLCPNHHKMLDYGSVDDIVVEPHQVLLRLNGEKAVIRR